MDSKRYMVRGLVVLASAGLLLAQETPLDPYNSIKFNLPDNSPVSILSANYGDSRASARGGVLVLDLHMALTLRNQDSRRIRGVTLLISAQELAPGGRASWSAPTLNAGPQETFPARIDVQLIRPLQSGAGPLVQVSLDGVLFEGLSFYGPNSLNSQRTMTFWELQNQRDRKYLKKVLSSHGAGGLQQEMLDSIARQAARPGLNVQVLRGGRSTSAAANPPNHMAQFAFLSLPDSPVQPVDGWAEISGNQARDARIQVRNTSPHAVRYVEVGWLVRDRDGREFLAGSVPASENDLYLPSMQSGRLLQDAALKFSKSTGQPLAIDGLKGFVSQVEYSDGRAWVPGRESLINSGLLSLLPPSPEEQRLADLYRKRGIDALVADLNRY